MKNQKKKLAKNRIGNKKPGKTVGNLRRNSPVTKAYYIMKF